MNRFKIAALLLFMVACRPTGKESHPPQPPTPATPQITTPHWYINASSDPKPTALSATLHDVDGLEALVELYSDARLGVILAHSGKPPCIEYHTLVIRDASSGTYALASGRPYWLAVDCSRCCTDPQQKSSGPDLIPLVAPYWAELASAMAEKDKDLVRPYLAVLGITL